jgi:hypothetical protein
LLDERQIGDVAERAGLHDVLEILESVLTVLSADHGRGAEFQARKDWEAFR